jgi:predicted ATPase
MITKVEVKSFKSLLSVSVELGSINVFIGANGSGKTNFLEALGLLSCAASGRVDDESLIRRGVRPGIPSLYKSSFKGSKLRNEIHIEAQSESASYSVGLFNTLRDISSPWKYHTENWHQGLHKIIGRSHRTGTKYDAERGLAALKAVESKEIYPAAVQLLDTLSEYAIFSPNTSSLRGLVPDSQQREPVGLSGGNLPKAALKMFQASNKSNEWKEVVDDVFKMIDWASFIGLVDSAVAPLSHSVARSGLVLSFRDKYMANKRNVLTGYDVSEGALYILFVAALTLLQGSQWFFSIDNFDHGLNPRLAKKLMECVCKWTINSSEPKQMLLTTHNPLILDGLDLRNDRIRLFALDRDNNGRTVINRVQVNEKMMENAEKKGWPLSRLWVMGHLGGVPNV